MPRMRGNCDNRKHDRMQRPASRARRRSRLRPTRRRPVPKSSRNSVDWPNRCPAGSTPRSNRYDDGLCRFSLRAVVANRQRGEVGRFDQQIGRRFVELPYRPRPSRRPGPRRASHRRSRTYPVSTSYVLVVDRLELFARFAFADDDLAAVQTWRNQRRAAAGRTPSSHSS